MANKFPLIIDPSTNRIVELPATDNLDLSGSDISSVDNITSTANITANYFIGNGSQLTGIVATNANYANFSGTAYSVSGANVTGIVANANIANVAYSVSGSNVSGFVENANIANVAYSVNGSNVSGTVANATYATSAGSATTAGTVTTAAQPNITSVGNLTSLVVTGNLDPINVNFVKFDETVVNGGNTGAATLTPNAAAGTIYQYNLTGNITLSTLSNAVAGTSMTIILTQDNVGNRLLTSTMKFAGNSKTLSTTANTTDIMCVFYDGTTYYASLTKGYV